MVETNHSSKFLPRKGLGTISDWKGVSGSLLEAVFIEAEPVSFLRSFGACDGDDEKGSPLHPRTLS